MDNHEDQNYLMPHFGKVADMRKNWFWFLLLGIVMILLGIVAIGSATYTTLFSVAFLGGLLALGGLVQIFHSFWSRQWSGFFLSLLAGILYLVTGFILLANPATSALTLTLLMALLFLVAGIFRMTSSIFLRFSHWGWVFFSGLISFFLGLIILSGWPVNGLWIIGLFIGIDLIFYGWSWVLASLVLQRIKF